MKFNLNTAASMIAALTGLLMVTLIPFAQSWLDLRLKDQAATITATSDAKYETQAEHAKDLDRISQAVAQSAITEAQHESRIQRIEDREAIVTRRKTDTQSQN